jgi:hypothetical protein
MMNVQERRSRTYLFCPFNMLATYCSNPVNSMLYFLKIAPQNDASDCSQRDMLVPSCLNRFLSAPANASIKQYPRTSYDILVRYLRESTTGPEDCKITILSIVVKCAIIFNCNLYIFPFI